ncbi:hypothetical protein K474DRAFT_1687073 [Panus rudis PR-1116 ss-1]|nr:hypothetical protein K474DRAFT_1687073 [Panus rudis PR-1116 ss-1]
MARGFTTAKKFRYGHAASALHQGKKRASSDCSTGGFYKSPTAGQTVQAGQPFNISWDTSCLDTSAVDIYLYDPKSGSNPRIHLWQNVNFALGSYEATLKPQWWNSTSSASLQLNIVPVGQPLFMQSLPAGPFFTATYDSSSDSSSASSGTTADTASGAIEEVNNFPHKEGISKGKIAAAVLIPLLVIIALIVGAYIKIKRSRAKEHRKEWKEAVDKRMSTISADWKSISAAGATAAIRNSMSVSQDGGPRASSFSFGGIRPSSTVALEGGQAGIGARGIQAQGGIDTETPQMSELRAGPRPLLKPTGDRVSRVSFAADPRPSGESRRTQYSTYSASRVSRTSRAFHTGHVPPLPERQDSNDMLSPTQTAGPLSLTTEDIQARMSYAEARPSMDAVMPALSMMRTGTGVEQDEMLLAPKPTTITPPLPSHQPVPPKPMSPIMGIMPMQSPPSMTMSPDAMLRAYAERRATVASPPPGAAGGKVGVPSGAVPGSGAIMGGYDANGMRVLYDRNNNTTNDAGLTTPNSSAPLMANANAERKSMAPTEASKYEEEDAYDGTAQ